MFKLEKNEIIPKKVVLCVCVCPFWATKDGTHGGGMLYTINNWFPDFILIQCVFHQSSKPFKLQKVLQHNELQNICHICGLISGRGKYQ